MLFDSLRNMLYMGYFLAYKSIPFVAIGTSILFAVSPWQTVKTIKRAKSTLQFSFAPFFFFFIQSIISGLYAYATANKVMGLTTMIGTILGLHYVLVFYRNTPDKSLPRRWLGYAGAFIFGLTWMASIHEPNESKMIIGIPTNILSTVTSMSPLGQLKTILARKDASCLPQGMSIMNIVAGTVWLIYGMILDDILVIFPNIIAITMGIIQVTLIVLYSSRGKTSNTERPSQSVSTMGAINEENDLLVSGAISSTGSRTTKAPLITVAKAAAVFKKNKIFMGVHEKV